MNAEKEQKIRLAQKNVNANEKDFIRKKGDGLHDWFKRKIATTGESDRTVRFLFGMFAKAAPLTKFPPTKWVLKKAAKLGDTYNTKGYSIPLYVDTKVQSLNIPIDLKKDMVTPPVELVKDAIRASEYRVIMHSCICRTMDGCKDYPLDLGCMFIGKAAKVCVEHGTGYEASVEQCLKHVNRAAECGLSAGAYWVEFEQYAWGILDKDFPDFIAFCFCCPCCCKSLKFEQLSGGELKHILHQSIGWHSEPIHENCNQCGACVKACPRNFISIKNGKVAIDEGCAGCGQCTLACKNNALHVVQYSETKPALADYFEKLHARW